MKSMKEYDAHEKAKGTLIGWGFFLLYLAAYGFCGYLEVCV